LVVGESSSRINERMGSVPIWKFLYLTHEILLRKAKKEENLGQKDKEEKIHAWLGRETNSV
jgi:hypothetical protein